MDECQEIVEYFPYNEDETFYHWWKKWRISWGTIKNVMCPLQSLTVSYGWKTVLFWRWGHTGSKLSVKLRLPSSWLDLSGRRSTWWNLKMNCFVNTTTTVDGHLNLLPSLLVPMCASIFCKKNSQRNNGFDETRLTFPNFADQVLSISKKTVTSKRQYRVKVVFVF